MGVRLRKAAMCLLVGGIFVTACAPSDSGEGEIIEDTTAVDAAVPAGPTDAEIAHIVVTANTIDIDAGRLAKEKGSSEEVIAFGDRMITDHTAVNEQASALAGRLNLTPADNATSQSLKASADQAMSDLHAASGADFDRAYLEREVAFHQQVLDAIDNTLLPNAQNADLRALLEQTRPAIASHLEMAKQLQSGLPAE